MGHHHRHHDPSSSSGSESDRKHKHKHKARADGAHKTKKDKKRSGGHKHKHKHRSHSPSAADLAAAAARAQRFLEQGGIRQLTADDYFARSAEFAHWLPRAHSQRASDLTADESRRLFDEFARLWNSGRLDDAYYDGSAAREATLGGAAERTSYRWGFAAKMSASESQELASRRAEIERQTYGAGAPQQQQSRSAMPLPERPKLAPRAPLDQAELEEQREREARERRMALKRTRQDDRVVEDELAPKATGRDAVIEKRKAAREERRAREDSPDQDVYGAELGSDPRSSFQAAVAARNRSREAREQRKAAEMTKRGEEYMRREDKSMSAIREMAAAFAASGGKIPERPQYP
eukprot:m51a1_g5765 hypothetical protein (350) ;mRNA; r:1232485-1233672